MKRYECTVSLESRYIIEIDDEDLGEDFLDEFKKHFYDYDDWDEHAKHIAIRKALGDTFIEGYGVPIVNGKRQVFSDERDMESAINIIPKYENDVDVDVYELEN